MASPNPSDKQDYAFWCREKTVADTKQTKVRKLQKNLKKLTKAMIIAKNLNMTAEQTHDYLAMLEAH